MTASNMRCFNELIIGMELNERPLGNNISIWCNPWLGGCSPLESLSVQWLLLSFFLPVFGQFEAVEWFYFLLFVEGEDYQEG